MDNKDIVRALLWAAVAFFAWQWMAVLIWPPPPPPSEQPASPITDSSGENGAELSVGPADVSDGAPGSVTTSSPTGPAAVESGTLAPVGGERRILTMGDSSTGKTGDYRMALTLSTEGASVLSAELNDYKLHVDRDSPPYPMLSEVVREDGATVRSFAIEADGGDVLNIDGELQSATPVRVEVVPAALRVFA